MVSYGFLWVFYSFYEFSIVFHEFSMVFPWFFYGFSHASLMGKAAKNQLLGAALGVTLHGRRIEGPPTPLAFLQHLERQ